MTDSSPAVPEYENVAGAPIIYFDIVAANGLIGGTIELELAIRNLIPTQDGRVTVKFATAARLRFSPIAATALKAAVDNSMSMLQQNPQQPVASPGKLN